MAVSRADIRVALEARVREILGSSWFAHIVYENEPYAPSRGQPYVVVEIDFATPSADEMGESYQEIGLMDLKLLFPTDAGWGDAQAEADRLCTGFKRKTTMVQNSTTVQVHQPPAQTPGFPVTDRGRPSYALPVRVPFFANVTA